MEENNNVKETMDNEMFMMNEEQAAAMDNAPQAASEEPQTDNTEQATVDAFTQTGTKTDESSFDYVYGTEKLFVRPVSIMPNTTDAVRLTAVKLTANGHSVSLQYLQLYHLNIVDPAAVYTDASAYAGASFTKRVGAAAQTATVTAVLYADATVSSDQDWVAIEQTSLSKGDATVTLAIDQNNTGAERKANVTLLSSTGAKTTVTVVQEK